MIKTMISFLILVAIVVGFIWLQIRLSRKENKWFGLILPLLGLLCSIMASVAIVSFHTVTQTTIQELNEDEENRREENSDTAKEELGFGETLGLVIPVFLITNIPTGVNLAIYASVRERKKQQSQMNKMNIQDL